jgi:hypothetical protein
MLFRESQKIKADIFKGLGFLFTVPIGNYGLGFIFQRRHDITEMFLSFLAMFFSVLLFFIAYNLAKREEKRIEVHEKNG